MKIKLQKKAFLSSLLVGSLLIIVNLVFYSLNLQIITEKKHHLAQKVKIVFNRIDEDTDLYLKPVGNLIFAPSANHQILGVDQVDLGHLITSSTNKGYNGNIDFLIAITGAGCVHNVVILSARETPGIGDKINSGSPSWLQGFAKGCGLNSLDSITGATITSTAVIEHLQYITTVVIPALRNR